MSVLAKRLQAIEQQQAAQEAEPQPKTADEADALAMPDVLAMVQQALDAGLAHMTRHSFSNIAWGSWFDRFYYQRLLDRASQWCEQHNLVYVPLTNDELAAIKATIAAGALRWYHPRHTCIAAGAETTRLIRALEAIRVQTVPAIDFDSTEKIQALLYAIETHEDVGCLTFTNDLTR